MYADPEEVNRQVRTEQTDRFGHSDPEIAPDDAQIGIEGLVSNTRELCNRSAQLAARSMPAIPIDTAGVNAAARRAFDSGDVQTARAELETHQDHISNDALGGMPDELKETSAAIEQQDTELAIAIAKENQAAERVDKFDRAPKKKGTPWSAISIVTVVVLAALTIFVFFSSLKVVHQLLEELGRVDDGADTLVLAPLTVIAPVAIYLIGLFQRDTDARKRLVCGVSIVALVCLVIWVSMLPIADAPGGGSWGSTDDEGVGFAWYISTTAQLLFDVFCAGACKLAIHLICEAHAGERIRLSARYRFHSKRAGDLQAAKSQIGTVKTKIKAKSSQAHSRMAGARKIAVDRFEKRLKLLRTGFLDLQDRDHPDERHDPSTHQDDAIDPDPNEN